MSQWDQRTVMAGCKWVKPAVERMSRSEDEQAVVVVAPLSDLLLLACKEVRAGHGRRSKASRCYNKLCKSQTARLSFSAMHDQSCNVSP